MSTQTTGTAVTASVVVEAPVERAFAVYTEDMASWWPKGHHVMKVEIAEMVVERHAGGRIFDRGVDGSTSQWGTVLGYEPPHRFVYAWNVSPQWQIETDPARTSEVEVRFVAETPARTRVEVEHRHIDRHGEGWESMRDAVGEGWGDNLASFARRIAA